MNAKLLIPIIAGTLFAVSAHAHDCSGGTNGGMDATGNQCNDVAAMKTDYSSGGATSPAAPLPKTETSKAPSSNKIAAKHTATRHTAARAQTKHS